jgi:NAD(P)-dependent dehydrogenase (short-subunit alcohol dehydrogenase family)
MSVEAAHPAAAMRLSGLEDRVAVVTGAASGIGRCVAETLATLGCRVAGLDRSAAGSEAYASYVGDVADETSVGRCFDQVEADLGRPELLVTCAGVFEETPLSALSAARWQATIDINLTGTYLCAARALPAMRERGFGRVVTMSSGAGIDGGTEACAHYAASKGGVIALTKALAKEVSHEGVTVNVVAPRNIRTPMIAGMEDDLVPQIPLGRLGEPDDVAAAVAFLCSGHASYVTGEVFVLNGGWW